VDGHKCRLHFEEPGVCISKKMLSPAGRRDVVCCPTPKACVESSRRGILTITSRQYEIGRYYVFAAKGSSGTLYLCNVVSFVV